MIEVSEAVNTSLVRMQQLDAMSLGRKEKLGDLNFEEIVPYVKQIVAYFNRIGVASLPQFSVQQQEQIRQQADSIYSIISEITKFDPLKTTDPATTRQSLNSQIRSYHDQLPSVLFQFVSYSVASSIDPTSVQQQFRAAMQAFQDDTKIAKDETEALKAQVEEVLQRVRDAAAEQGVASQATYFKDMAAVDGKSAEEWLKICGYVAAGTFGLALVFAFTYKIPFIAPKNTAEAIQLVSSKIFILGILAYSLTISVRNFLSHKHNVTINNHRQNALKTFTAFVDAAPTTASREIVLTHAAAAVFAPQDTGFIRNQEPTGGNSLLEILTKAPIGEGKN
jgi:ElaB/YqjD/DUF883 family membrane-anchored ribosome-binding protein